jgi:hypothetical protein
MKEFLKAPEASTYVGLSEAVNEAEIQKTCERFCTVYLLGRNPPTKGFKPMVVNVEYLGRTDFEIIEQACLIWNKRI